MLMSERSAAVLRPWRPHGSRKSMANTSTCCRGKFHEERTAWDASLLSPRAEGPFEVLAGLGRQCLFGPTVRGLATVQPCRLQQLQKADIPPSPLPGCPGSIQGLAAIPACPVSL